MRSAVPTRFEFKWMAIFITAMFIGQGIEGTNIVFMILTAVYLVLWALAFNAAGGLFYPSGAFIFANGLFSVGIGLGAKVLLWEPGERNLQTPIHTMICYCIGMLMLLLAAQCSRLLRPRVALIGDFDSLEATHRGSIICFVVGLMISGVSSLGSASTGSLLSAIRQLNEFPTMAVMLGTAYAVRSTNGRRSTNWVVIAGIALGIFFGFVFFGKQSFLGGFVSWGIAASIYGYRFRKSQIIGLAIGGAFMVYYLVPYSQYVRDFGSSTGSIRDNIPVALFYLSDLNRTRQLYYDSLEDYSLQDDVHLYDHREGFLDRLVIVAADDALINYTDHGHVYGFTPLIATWANVVPHFIWKDKPIVNEGNIYANELGWLPEGDDTTGVAFSTVANAYHDGGWFGIWVIMPITVFISFIVFDSLAGDARVLPFALLPVQTYFNMGAAGGLGSPVHEATYGVLAYLLIVWTCKTGVPKLLNILGPKSFRPVRDGAASIVPTR